MRVLMINVSCGTGSTGRICTDLAASLEKLGHEVKIAYGRDEVQSKFEKYAVKIGTDIEIKEHVLYSRFFDASALGSKKGTKKFLEWIKAYDPDIIHLHNIHGYYINVPLLFAFLKTFGKPIIWTLHDCWAFTGHAAYCDSASCEKWKKGCSHCPLLREYPKSFVDRSANNWKWKRKILTNIPQMRLVTPSFWLSNLLKESILSEYPVDVIHNGVDTSVFMPLKNDFRIKYGINNKKMCLGVSDIWNKMKGLDDFVELSKMLDEETVIVLVGLSKDQINNLPDKMIGIEEINSSKEKSLIYSTADVFLNLSYCDNYPTTYMEAKSHGTPVISYNTGRSSESEGKSSIVIQKGNLKEVVSAIKKIQCNSPRNNSNIDSARNYQNSASKSNEINNCLNYLTAGKNEFSIDHRGVFSYKEKYGFLGKYVILGVASVWDYRKGLEDFVQLYRQLDRKRYDIVLIGLSERQIKELPKGIRAIPHTANVEELRILYGIADVFLNLTIEDNYPTTNIEATCCGTPVITYRTGGSPESVDIQQVFEKNDLIGIIKLLSDNKKRLVVSKKDDFDKTTMMENYLTIYNNQFDIYIKNGG